MRERPSPRKRRLRRPSDGQAGRDLRIRGSGSCIAEAFGQSEAMEVLETWHLSLRIMFYEYSINNQAPSTGSWHTKSERRLGRPTPA